MNNFQLYRTNLYLGGQMKWDLVVDSLDTTLYVSDFHLSPISPNIPYTHRSNETLLNNRHQDNVKKYYNDIRSNFYNEGLNPEHMHNWPIISEDTSKCYSNIYDMGCKRAKSYKLYNKQFEFFCPLWLEKIDDKIKFEIIIKGIESNMILSSNALIFDLNGVEAHDKFIRYFNDYVKDAGIDVGNDDLLNIDFNLSHAATSGLDAEMGIFATKNVSTLVKDITLRERPLMDVDKMLVDSFAKNNTIARQLFNFNLCFNIEDILSGAITQLMKGKEISISVNVYVGDKMLQKKDFYTEYEFIPKNVITNTNNKKTDVNINVLDYLHDFESLDLISKNKLSQNIIHWSLCDSEDYLFNAYNGFSGIYAERTPKGEIVYYENDHQYENAPNTIIKNVNKAQNTTGWINTINILYWKEFYKYIVDTEDAKKNGAYFGDRNFVNKIKYSYVPKINDKGFYCIGLHVSSDIYSSIKDNHESFKLSNYCELSKTLLLAMKDDLIMLITSDESNLVFSNVKDLLYFYSQNDYSFNGYEIPEEDRSIVTELYSVLNSKIDPVLISFGGSLKWNVANGPNSKSKEIEYYNDNDTQEYIMRYDGKIKPMFVDSNKKLYYKDCVTEDIIKNSENRYRGYVNTGFEPLFPSLDYFAINRLENWKYNELPKITLTSKTEPVFISESTEYSWYEISKNIILNAEFKYVYINRKSPDGYKAVSDIAKEYIGTLYDVEDEKIIDYIYRLYDITNEWEYFSEYNVNDYVYTLSFKLK